MHFVAGESPRGSRPWGGADHLFSFADFELTHEYPHRLLARSPIDSIRNGYLKHPLVCYAVPCDLSRDDARGTEIINGVAVQDRFGGQRVRGGELLSLGGLTIPSRYAVLTGPCLR